MLCLVRRQQYYNSKHVTIMINVDALRSKLQESGVRVNDIEVEPRVGNRILDFLVRIDVDGREIVLLVEEKERPHLVQLRLAAEQIKQHAGLNQVPVIVASFLGPNRRALLREIGVSYLDLAGNVYLRAPGILIDREQKQNPFGYDRETLNPFSDKASIVLRLLLYEPHRYWKIREIAKVGGINAGWVSRVVDSLVKRSLADFDYSKGISLVRREEVLKEWSDLYDWHRNKFYYYYCHAYDVQEILERVSKLTLEHDRSYALGFQAGAYLVAPYASFNQVHLLIDGGSFDKVRPEIEWQLQLEPRREGANLVLVRPYYKRSALFDAREIKKWWVASDIQLYLDLHRYPLRGEEQAEHLLEKLIRPKLKRTERGSSGG